MHTYSRKGFSLVELIITLALLSLLASVAVPGFAALTTKNQLTATHNAIAATLRSARAYAVVHGTTVEICASRDGKSCRTDWSQGWIVHEPDSGRIISHFQLDTDHPLHWSGFSRSIRYHRDGTSFASNGRFYQCLDNKAGWQLVLSRQGRLRQATAAEIATANCQQRTQ